MSPYKNRSRSIILVAFILAILLMVASCSSSNSIEAKPQIITSFYPLDFAVNRIVGDLAEVANITPIGTEPHDIELTPSLTEKIMEADLVVVMGADFQSAIEKTAINRDGATTEIIDSIKEENNQELIATNPHIWLDPAMFQTAVNLIADEVIELLPEKKTTLENNRDLLLEDLDTLDTEFKEGLSRCESTTFVTSHDSFSFLAKRYGLTQESIAGISPENEPTPKRVIELEKIIKTENIDVVFTEELVSPEVAQTLSREAGIKTAVLSPLESLTKEQQKNGENYFSIMRSNLKKLSNALRCDQST